MNSTIRNSTIKTVIALRHGCTDFSSDHIGSMGTWEMQKIVPVIQSRIGPGRRIKILHSAKARCAESAKILSDALNAPMEAHNSFQDDQYRDAPLMVEMAEKMADDADVVIIVTHFEAPAGIMNCISRSLGGKGYLCIEARNGQGFVIEIPSGVIEPIARQRPPEPSKPKRKRK